MTFARPALDRTSGERYGDLAAAWHRQVNATSVAEQRARSLAIAPGSRQPDPTEPNVWFPSVVSVSRVLSDENMALLKIIREQRPQSMDALAKVVGKQAPNVSRSLHLMAQYGPVRLVKHGRTVTPEATSEHVSVNFA